MHFDIAAFTRYNFRAFFKTKGENYRLTPKRFLILIVWLLLYIPAQLINRLCFLLDEILFPGYRQQKVQNPIFIIGNPRSGTTFLHRLMYQDTDTFTAFTVWEMVFAPSIIQRKIIWAIIKIARWIGYPINQRVNSINDHLALGEFDSAHSIRLNEAEEDEHILIHNWTSASLWGIYPFPDELLPYFLFDQEIPEKKQQKVMSFYKNMIQRHLYAHGGQKILLSKNPSHTSKLAALTKTFPDARFINLVRTPFKAMPSMLDYMSVGWRLFCDPVEAYPYKEEFFKVMKFYYLYPVEFFKDKKNRCNFMMYDDLVQHPNEIVEDLYIWLDLKYPQKFKEIVKQTTKVAGHYQSQHEYSIEKMGLTEERIYKEFEEVFSYYEFDHHNLELPDHVMYWELNEWPQIWKSQRKHRQFYRKMRNSENRYLRKKKKTILLDNSKII